MSSSHDLLSETVEGLDLAIRQAREQVAADPVLKRMSEDLDRLLASDTDPGREAHAG